MSEASRQRRLYVENRLEEFESKYGPLPERCLPETPIDPSWGPVGSRLQREQPDEYEHVLALHQDLLKQERVWTHTEAPASPVAPPAPPEPAKRALPSGELPGTPEHVV